VGAITVDNRAHERSRAVYKSLPGLTASANCPGASYGRHPNLMGILLRFAPPGTHDTPCTPSSFPCPLVLVLLVVSVDSRRCLSHGLYDCTPHHYVQRYICSASLTPDTRCPGISLLSVLPNKAGRSSAEVFRSFWFHRCPLSP
jgi:hypothetical protein